MRVGHGYDVHRLTCGRPLVLCGVSIAHQMGLDGHSDADVAVHALMDALLGAAALGDIGALFPDTDPTYRGADSMRLLENVYERVREKGFRLGNLDLTILAQKPKLAPYTLDMRKNLAKALSVDLDFVSVKATTEEGLGFTGREEAIAAHCVVLLTET